MKFKKKPYTQRKVFKRKTGGPKFMVSGKVKYPSPISMASSQKSQSGMVAGLLKLAGFRVRAM